MRRVKPVQPIRAVRAIGRIVMRPVPSLGQLRQWLRFARRKASERSAPLSAASGHANAAPPETPGRQEDATLPSRGAPHVDRRA